MSKRFAGEITLAATTATNLLAAMVTAGYTGSPMAHELMYTPTGDVRQGTDNTVSGTVGGLVKAGVIYKETGKMIDLKQIWLYSTAGTAVQVIAQGY